MKSFMKKYVPHGQAKKIASIAGLWENQLTNWKRGKDIKGSLLIYLCRAIVTLYHQEKDIKLDYVKVLLEALQSIEYPNEPLPEAMPIEKHPSEESPECCSE